MAEYTETLGLKKTNMETDGDDLFLFDEDLDENWDKIDIAIKELINKQSATGIPPSICSGLRKIEKDGKVFLKWKDPDDTIIDGQVLCSWKKTIVVGKAGSLPESENDGEIIIENSVRNAYNTTALEIELPESDLEFQFRLFPVSMNGVVCYDLQNKFGSRVYEFIINPNDSNPAIYILYL